MRPAIANDNEWFTMLDSRRIIDKYYPEENLLKHILLTHSGQVTDFALQLAGRSSLSLDEDFVYEAGMLHDIGIFMTYAPKIQCFGEAPYLCHGYLGAELLRKEGFPRHALVCERHTGAGISKEEVLALNLPVPAKDMIPLSIEEKLICFADAFYSKTYLDKKRSLAEARRSIAIHGEEGAKRFDEWCELFL